MPAGFGSLGIDAAYAMLLNVIYLTAAISAGKKGQHWLQALGLWSCASDSFLPGSFTTQPCSLLGSWVVDIFSSACVMVYIPYFRLQVEFRSTTPVTELVLRAALHCRHQC